MPQPAVTKTSFSWLRFIVWPALILLSLTTLFVASRWAVMSHGHEKTLRISRSNYGKQTSGSHVDPQTTPLEKETARGDWQAIPPAAIPHFGKLLTGDETDWKNFEKDLGEIRDFLNKTESHHNRALDADGIRRFRATLQNIGVVIADTMTEAEAASEFLKHVERFSNLLAKWREAVGQGPIFIEDDDHYFTRRQRHHVITSVLDELLSAVFSAHLLTGNADAAWQDWQAMKNSSDRSSELYHSGPGHDYSMNPSEFKLASRGLEMGIWNETRMLEISDIASRRDFIALARKDVQIERERQDRYYDDVLGGGDDFSRNLLFTSSPLHQTFNKVRLALITRQQIEDNQALGRHRLDSELCRFDPVTGCYVQPTEEEKKAGAGIETPWFDSYYFVVDQMVSMRSTESLEMTEGQTARSMIKDKAEYDLFRLATALEIHNRRNGSYPDQLEAVSGLFPNGIPRDVATGHPYLYQRDAGGYKVWSTGIDGKSDGGDDMKDITWKQPARKN